MDSLTKADELPIERKVRRLQPTADETALYFQVRARQSYTVEGMIKEAKLNIAQDSKISDLNLSAEFHEVMGVISLMLSISEGDVLSCRLLKYIETTHEVGNIMQRLVAVSGLLQVESSALKMICDLLVRFRQMIAVAEAEQTLPDDGVDQAIHELKQGTGEIGDRVAAVITAA